MARPKSELSFKKPERIKPQVSSELPLPDGTDLYDLETSTYIEDRRQKTEKDAKKERPEHLTQKPFRIHALFQLRDRLEAQQNRK